MSLIVKISSRCPDGATLPRVVAVAGNYRVVTLGSEDDHSLYATIERKETDAMGSESWRAINTNSSADIESALCAIVHSLAKAGL